jgi:hypothetical protein
VKEVAKRVNDIAGVKESDTGLAPPSRWDLVSDKQAMQEEQPLQVHAMPCPATLGTLLVLLLASAAAMVPGTGSIARAFACTWRQTAQLSIGMFA